MRNSQKGISGICIKFNNKEANLSFTNSEEEEEEEEEEERQRENSEEQKKTQRRRSSAEDREKELRRRQKNDHPCALLHLWQGASSFSFISPSFLTLSFLVSYGFFLVSVFFFHFFYVFFLSVCLFTTRLVSSFQLFLFASENFHFSLQFKFQSIYVFFS